MKHANFSIVFSALKRNIISAALPNDLVLADNIIASDFHPIFLISGVQRLGWRGQPIPLPSYNYNELILLIPFVRHVNGDLWHNYVVRMYVDSNSAKMGGNVIWGYQKEMAEFDFSSGVKIAKSGIDKFASNTTNPGCWKSYSKARLEFDNFKEMEEIMKMPILGTKGTSYICSYFEWTYSFGEIRKISQSFNFVSEFVSGMSTWLGAHSNLPQGAWQVEDMRWQLDYLPFDCKFNS